VLQSNARLKHSADIQAVRDARKNWRGSLVILAAHKNNLPTSRFAFICSRRVGKAVVRNRVRRLLRESVRTHFNLIEPGWDCLLIARPAIQNASFLDVQTAVFALLGQANLLVGELP
jgi:ribonuclease P protein component